MTDHTTQTTDEAIDAQAAGWWVRRDAGPLSAAERADFEAWLAADPTHHAAFTEIDALCRDMQSAPVAKKVAASTAPSANNWRRALFASAVALASLAMVLAFDDLTLPWRADVYTATGETRLVTLADGSHVQLAGHSAIAFDLQGRERRISLLQGEAWFEVAPDAARPFIVAAALGAVMARGTAFDIALVGDGARVTVTEHSVAIASDGHTALLSQGQQSSFARKGAIAPGAPVNIDDETAWRRGKLIFVNRPLREVVETLSRYRRGYIAIPTAATRELRVSGVFDAADVRGALKAIEESLGLTAAHLTEYLVILGG